MDYIAHYNQNHDPENGQFTFGKHSVSTPRHPGIRPFGDGDTPYKRNQEFIDRIKAYRSKGMSEGEIAKKFGYSSSGELKARESAAKGANKKAMYEYAADLRARGLTNTEIGQKLGGLNESSVRTLLAKDRVFQSDETERVLTMLRDAANKTGMVEVGPGNEISVGVTRNKLDAAVYLIQDEGYKVFNDIRVKQNSMNNKETILKVVTPNDPKYDKKYVYEHLDEIQTLTQLHPKAGAEDLNKLGMRKPESIKASRIFIRYADDPNMSGEQRDGLIEIRRGVPDLDLGADRYAQVRIAVDDKYYLKGMAIYSDNVPDGYDVIFNSNKTSDKPINKVFKSMEHEKYKDEAGEWHESDKIDWDNPFGAQLKPNGGQYTYTDFDGKEKLSAINKVRGEGDWSEWANNYTLASQMLAKQPTALAKKQLKLTRDIQQSNYDEIMSISNPTVKRKMLIEFADECDALSVNLKAAALPRQATKVIIPVPEMKDNEIYAPTFNNGEKVVLIRYPHQGKFEIPELTVNNNRRKAKEALSGLSSDAVGINANVAAMLSGADFDGDTVLVIPNNDNAIKGISSTLKKYKELETFEPKKAYGTENYTPEQLAKTKLLPKTMVNKEMGKISNLVTDMTIQDAPPDEMVRAVKHAQVIIDAHKHKLDYKRSEEENGIAELKKTYQSKGQDNIDLLADKYGITGIGPGGATTLLSRNKTPIRIDRRQGGYRIDPTTGEKIWRTSDKTFTRDKIIDDPDNPGKKIYIPDPNAKPQKYKQEVPLLTIVNDARDISSGTPIEEVYAKHSNELKALANKARLESLNLKTEYNSEAAKTFSKEVASLKAKYNDVLLNAPAERIARARAQKVAQDKIRSKNLGKDDKKEKSKIQAQALEKARADTGAHRRIMTITNSEWNAMMSGAVHDTDLYKFLGKMEGSQIRELAIPKTKQGISQAKINKAKSMARSGFSLAQIAEALGYSTTTIQKAIKDEL